MDDLTRADLEIVLPGEGFAPDSYRLYGGFGVGECYVLDHGPAGWEVYYSERGTKGGLRVFRTEGEACGYFLDLLRRDPTTRQRR
ncbi:hypothetical protein [Salinispora arenicola]|uniref:hypothetical protein n=1 Tax=Salinispora arenicola TaxID=168697 RepID=UPI00037312C2|nr:hypothetical protein [Salinispora arenicola]